MKNYYNNKMRDRLNYCREWQKAIDIYWANKEITKKTNEEY